MTPLNQLLLQAIDIAKQREPGLSDAELARRAGLEPPNLAKAKHACGPSTLAAVLDLLELDVALVEKPSAHK